MTNTRCHEDAAGAEAARGKTLPPIPHFVIPGAEDKRLETFSRALQAMGGRFCRSSEISSPLAWIREHIPDVKIICSAVPEVPSDRAWSVVRKPQDLADVDEAVVRAVLGMAESGSVLFTEAELKVIHGAQGVRSLTVMVDG
jgi:L-lactate dehydrogenase complex protein LldG